MIPPDDDDAIEITDDEEHDMTPMQAVKSLVAEKPNLSRWFVSSPELMKKQEKAKQKKDKKKKPQEREVSDEEESPKERKKKKRKLTTDDEDNEDELTAYIRVLKPQPPPPPTVRGRSRSAKPNSSELPYVTRGPFTFDPDSTTFDDFMSLMSDALPCPVANIVLDKTEWKPQTPMNRAFLPLGGTGGFGALKKQMKKSKDKTLIVFWDVKGDNNVGGGAGEAGPSNAVAKEEDKTFDFSQLETTSTEDSVGQQKLTFDQAIASHLEELQDRWPVNEAGQRIYTDDKGFKWDLTPIRLNVWAAHKAQGMATVDKPPTSAQFDIKNRIKIQPVPSVPVTVQPIPPPAAAPVTAVTDQILALALSMLQQQQHQPVPMPIVPVAPVQPPSNPIPDPSPVPSAPPSPAKPLQGQGYKEFDA
ncbi:hypothetical protein C8F04DRAFT_1346936 [Mycena alexandri]|uniref:Uncharacterized protein n=1 Tax=Mycena alexandri TaxID=1745969 RepID=A0AAD6SW62_9AGAR|nr:hypothetical protein C8F04DRAFT_1346936 [Mycena alexandri]